MVIWIDENPEIVFAGFETKEGTHALDVGICGWLHQPDGSFVPVLELPDGTRFDLPSYCKKLGVKFVAFKIRPFAAEREKQKSLEIGSDGMVITDCGNDEIEIKFHTDYEKPDRLSIERFRRILWDKLCSHATGLGEQKFCFTTRFNMVKIGDEFEFGTVDSDGYGGPDVKIRTLSASELEEMIFEGVERLAFAKDFSVRKVGDEFVFSKGSAARGIARRMSLVELRDLIFGGGGPFKIDKDVSVKVDPDTSSQLVLEMYGKPWKTVQRSRVVEILRQAFGT